MAPPRPPRLLPALRALLYWSLVYGYCGLCASVHLLKLLWSIGRAPAQTFRRAARANPPACLNDPSLGTHCYVRIKVKADAGLETGEGEGRGWGALEAAVPRAPGRLFLDASRWLRAPGGPQGEAGGTWPGAVPRVSIMAFHSLLNLCVCVEGGRCVFQNVKFL
jgi:hypothetical protein